MKIFYDLNGALYANITNQCPCACTFCIRKNSDSVGGNESLWLEHEPSLEEIKAAFDAVDHTKYDEVVFCGYGEPMSRPTDLIETARYIKETSGMKIRVNTNGLVSFMHPTFDLYAMRGAIDRLSISLNASDPEKYDRIVRSRFGLPAYNAMLNFAIVSASFIPDVSFTIVDVIGEEEVKACRQRSDDLGIPLRVRHYISDNEAYQ
ncbi:MAG: TIGR04100 family radical SAM protein [Bacteroides sp.]|nr:TIGR04100 family radical SAM protein [Roseburia sp.]MCM1461181.1 TIGR04100 family radical SAM protein [Bacteroides sp.]